MVTPPVGPGSLVDGAALVSLTRTRRGRRSGRTGRGRLLQSFPGLFVWPFRLGCPVPSFLLPCYCSRLLFHRVTPSSVQCVCPFLETVQPACPSGTARPAGLNIIPRGRCSWSV